MVTVRLTVEVQDESQASAIRAGLRAWCEGNDGCRIVEHHEICPQCGAPMVFEPLLQEWVCHHEEQEDSSSAIGPATLPPG